MKAKQRVASAVLAGGLVLGAGGLVIGGSVASAQAPCVPATVDATQFVEDGELDLNAYLAAVQAANQVCAGGAERGTGANRSGALPRTGANQSSMLPIAAGLVAVGGAALASSAVRRRSVAR